MDGAKGLKTFDVTEERRNDLSLIFRCLHIFTKFPQHVSLGTGFFVLGIPFTIKLGRRKHIIFITA